MLASHQPHTVTLEQGHGFSDTSHSGCPTRTDDATWPVSPTTQNKRTISFIVNKLSARRGINHKPGQFHQPVKNKTNPPDTKHENVRHLIQKTLALHWIQTDVASVLVNTKHQGFSLSTQLQPTLIAMTPGNSQTKSTSVMGMEAKQHT